MLKITTNFFIDETNIQFNFLRSPGPGGQNVNKVSSGVELRINIHSLALPIHVYKRLIIVAGKKINRSGELIIKATRFRTQERNKQDALNRLKNLLQWAAKPVKPRKKTSLSFNIKQRRLDKKKLHSRAKSLRSKVKIES